MIDTVLFASLIGSAHGLKEDSAAPRSRPPPRCSPPRGPPRGPRTARPRQVERCASRSRSFVLVPRGDHGRGPSRASSSKREAPVWARATRLCWRRPRARRGRCGAARAPKAVDFRDEPLRVSAARPSSPRRRPADRLPDRLHGRTDATLSPEGRRGRDLSGARRDDASTSHRVDNKEPEGRGPERRRLGLLRAPSSHATLVQPRAPLSSRTWSSS